MILSPHIRDRVMSSLGLLRFSVRRPREEVLFNDRDGNAGIDDESFENPIFINNDKSLQLLDLLNSRFPIVSSSATRLTWMIFWKRTLVSRSVAVVIQYLTLAN